MATEETTGAAAAASTAKPAAKEKPKAKPEEELARTVLEYDIRFTYEYPAFSAEYVMSNNNLSLTNFEYTPFGAKFTVANLTNKPQLLNGSIENNDPQNLFIFGRALHAGKEGSVERTIAEFADDSDVIEFSSDWLQDNQSATVIADWVAGRLSTPKTSISVTLVGTPLIEVGDIVTIRHSELHLTDAKRFLVTSVSVKWSDGLETSLEAVEI